ncbi:hypothetical protein NUW58_g6591 [Xylaria curta]|uniref:Uncharacterized protein n=1 Tax=Xylaria curta TaxID=42375 RepID=A0ACC1NR58_9PEZI|nr:hypothetical protein NUW58_g6591 [Xylaria curta]
MGFNPLPPCRLIWSTQQAYRTVAYSTYLHYQCTVGTATLLNITPYIHRLDCIALCHPRPTGHVNEAMDNRMPRPRHIVTHRYAPNRVSNRRRCAPPPPESEDDEPSLEIPDGKACRRKACNATYKKGQPRSDDEKCVHHPGAPIFHEGSKGYSCCKRRVLEFDQFMKIEGCKTSPRHLFIGSGQDKAKKKQDANGGQNGEELLETVRHDFYQTPTTVIASFFLKKIDSARATVKLNPSTLDLDLPTNEPAPKRYKTSVPLFGEINTQKSTFKILGTKLEVSLYKADGASWPVLRSDEQRTGEILQVGRAGRVQ